MRMFITALFIITQTWKQSICTSINKQTLGLRCNELFYSNKTETSYQAGQKMVRNLKYILPSERTQEKLLHTAQIQACDSLERRVHYRGSELISGYQDLGEGFLRYQRLSRGESILCDMQAVGT